MGAGASAVIGPQIRKAVDVSNRIISKIAPKKKVNAKRLTTKESPSILRVEVIQAKNLPAKDDNGLSDPYVCLHYGDDAPVVRTEIRKKTLTPQWNQTLDFAVWQVPPEVSGLVEPRVTVKCWDWEESGIDQYMGAFDIDVDSLVLDGDPISGWFLLEDPAEPEAFGEVELKMYWMTRLNTGPDAIVSVNVLGAQDLPAMGSDGFVNAFTTVVYTGDRDNVQTTLTKDRTLDPMWREVLEFPAKSSEIGNDSLEVRIFHKGTFKDKLVGWTSISFASFNFEQEAVYYDLNSADWNPTIKKARGKKEGGDNETEDLGRVHLQIKLKKKRTITTPDTDVRITILEAKKLPPRARSDICDPYIMVEFEKVIKKTQVRFKQSVSSTPEWSESFVYQAWSDRLDSALVITVMDHQEWRKDKVIGSVPLNLIEYSVGDFYEEWKALACPDFPECTAELRFQIAIRNKPKEKDHDAVLRMRVIEAKNLPAMDWGGTSDPYCVATFENKTKRTPTIFKTLNPVWNALLAFPTKADEMDNLLQLECFDQDLGSKDDSCGRCEIDVAGLPMNKTIKNWLPLRDIKHPEYQGKILVEIVLMAKLPVLTPDCQLQIKVVSCKDLIAADATGTSDPYVVIDFDDTRRKTGTRFNTLNPTFDEDFVFPHHSKNIHELVRFEVFDYDLVGVNQSLGFVYMKMGDRTIDQKVTLNLNIRVREDQDVTGELTVEVLVKRLSEFMVNLMPRSKSMDIIYNFEDLRTGMTKSVPNYTLKRLASLGSSGLVLDCESTNPLKKAKEGDAGFVDPLEELYKVEQERRRLFDLQYNSELRQEQVNSNLKRGRNTSARCALCGEAFSIIHKPVQCPVDKYWYHTYAIRTVSASENTCYEQHKGPLKIWLRRQKLREDEKEEEMDRRAMWDRDHEREKAAKANRSRLKKAVMARDFSKFAKRTRMGVDEANNPPFAVEIFFDHVEYNDFTKNSKQRRRFLQSLREDVASVLNLSDIQISILQLDAEQDMVVVQISPDPEGKDKWTPEQLAKRLSRMIVGDRRHQRLYSTQVLVSAIKVDLKGPVLSPVAALLLDEKDVVVNEKAKARPRDKPDQAGRLPCYVYICSDYDDMKPERDYLAEYISPVVDSWCAASRAQFVPVDLRHGVTRAECYHANVVATHLDEIDRCFPFFVCMLGATYGWVPDDFYRNYGELEEPRFSWLKEMPDSMSLVHLEIVHAYFRKKVGNDADTPGGGHDDDFCLFYFRDNAWMSDPSFITDYQLQARKVALELRELQESRAKQAQAAREMDGMDVDFDPSRMDWDYVDIRILEGFDLGYWLDQKKAGNQETRKGNLRKSGTGGIGKSVGSIAKSIGKGALLAGGIIVGGAVGLLAYGAIKAGGAAVGFLTGGRKLNRLSKHKQHKHMLKKAGKMHSAEETEAMYEALLENKGDNSLEEGADAKKEGGADAKKEDAATTQDKKRGKRGQTGLYVECNFPMSLEQLDAEKQSTCIQVLSRISAVKGIELDDLEASDASVKATFWVPMPDPEAAEVLQQKLLVEDAKELNFQFLKAKVLQSQKAPAKISIKPGERKAEVKAKAEGGEAEGGQEEEEGEDEDEDDGEDEEDEDDDGAIDEDAARREMQEGLEKKTVRQVQVKDEAHTKLVQDLANCPKNLPPSAKVDLLMNCYRGKWWTGDRMKEYFQYITDDASRAAVLAGAGDLYRRCVDADSGGMNEIIEMIKDVPTQRQVRDKISTWQDTSKSRGAVAGSVEKDVVVEETQAEKGAGTDEAGGEVNAADAGKIEGGEGKGEGEGEGAKGEGEVLGEEAMRKAAEEALKKKMPKHQRLLPVSRLKQFKGSFRWAIWKEMAVSFEKDEPLLVIKGEIKLNLRSYDMEKWEDVGEDLSWGQTAVLGEDWESSEKGAHCIVLQWNKRGWPQAHNEVKILFSSRDVRDEMFDFVKKHMHAWPILEKFPDGSEKVYLDSGGKGFQEAELEYPEPAFNLFEMPTVGDSSATAQPAEGSPEANALPGGDALPVVSQEVPRELTEEEQRAIVEEFFKTKPPPSASIQDFALSFKMWSPLFAKWIKQEALILCLDVKEACNSTGHWTEDVKVPNMFGALQLWEENTIFQARSLHDNVMARVVSHAETIKDKRAKFYRWEGQDLALVVDHHGYATKLIDYHTEAAVWEFTEEGAFEKWNSIMLDAQEVTEAAIAQGTGAGIFDQKKKSAPTTDEAPGQPATITEGGSSDILATPPASDAAAATAEPKQAGKDAATGLVATASAESGTAVEKADIGTAAVAVVVVAEVSKAPSDAAEPQAVTVTESSDAAAASAEVSGGKFGAESQSQPADAAAPTHQQTLTGEDHASRPKSAGSSRSANLSRSMSFKGDVIDRPSSAKNTKDRPTSALRPASAKSQQRSQAGSVRQRSQAGSQAGSVIPDMYLLNSRLLELITDKEHNPIRLDDMETFDTWWSGEAQTVSQLQEFLQNAVLITRELYESALVKRKIVQSQGKRYMLVGTFKNFDEPDGEPEQLLDLETEEPIWQSTQFDADTTWESLTKHGRLVATHCTALRVLMSYRGVNVEVIEDGFGGERAIAEQISRKEIWRKDMSESLQKYQAILDECESIGYTLIKWIDEDPPLPPLVFTTIDFILWQCECLEKDKLVFTWLGPKEKNATPQFGSFLETATGKAHMPATLILKAATQKMRDEWFKVIRAASIWARTQEEKRLEWKELSENYAAQLDEGGGHVLASSFVKKTEDQLDAYRAWVLLILDHSRNMFGWWSKSKLRMAEFKKNLVAQLAEGTGIAEKRFRILSVHKADQKKTWKAMDRDPTFYFAISKKTKSGGILVEMAIDPDLAGIEKMERTGLRDSFVTSKSIAESLILQCNDPNSTLRTAGNLIKTLVHVELKFQEEDVTDKGDPLWIELHLGSQKCETKIRGTHSANFNEMFRFYIEPEELGTAQINVRIYSTRTFGGKQLIGKCKVEVSPMIPNTVQPLTLIPDENEHGMLVCQCKLHPRNVHVIPKRTGPYRKPILKELPAVGLRERHLNTNETADKRLLDLKAILCIETNVYQNYPCWYIGLDALGRAQLDGLSDLGDRMADDIFSCLKGYGRLQIAMQRPMDMLHIEQAQHDAYQKKLAYVCAGRYENLLKAQQFIIQGLPQTILVISGKPGTGKSNFMSCLHKMFSEGHRVQPNPHTKQLQLDAITDNSKHPRGHAWTRPEVVSIFMGASNGNTTPRYLLYLLMNKLAEILRPCRMKMDASGHKEKVAPNDPSVLFPIPHEYNKLRLQFLTLCSSIDSFTPHKRVLILIDQIDSIDGMRFDWLPVDMPKSLRLVISSGKANLIKKMATSTKSIKIDLLQLQPFAMLARKEMAAHLLRQKQRAINMEQMDKLVQLEGACLPDYLHLAIEVLAAFKQDMTLIMPVINLMADTTEKLSSQVLERMEDYCGRQLVKRCLSFILVSKYGLTEMELRIILACDAVSDQVSHRLPEQNAGTPAAYPNTTRENRQAAFDKASVLLPMSLWSPLSYMIKPYLMPSHEYQATKYQFMLKNFVATVSTRYGLEAEPARVYLHTKIAAYYRARADPELQYTWRSQDYRAAQSLIYHKIGAHDWSSVITMLTDIGFLEYCVNLGGVHDLCHGIKHAISVLDSAGDEEGADKTRLLELMQLSSFMNANAQVLLDHPAVLIQMMANEPKTSAVAQIALRRIQGGWEGRNWLKRLRHEEGVSTSSRTMRGHKGWIRSLAVTVDSKYLVSGADDKTARFWAVETGAFIHQLTGHREAITAVDMASNGLYLITSSMDAAVKLWDIRSGIELANLFVGSAATCCKFSNDASIIMAGTLDSTIHLFDTRTFQELYVLRSHRLGVRALTFSKDGTKILSGGSDAMVMLWDLKTFAVGVKYVEAPSVTMAKHTNGVRTLAWNPRNASQAVSGGEDCKVLVWNLEEGSVTRTLIGHHGAVLTLCFTPSGAYVLSASYDSSIIVWDPNLEEVLFRFWGHEGPIYSVCVTVDEYMAVSAGADSVIKTWDVRGLLREDPDEPHIVSKEASAALKVERKPEIKARELMQYGDIYCLAFSPSGDILLSGSQDTSYALRNFEDGRIIGEPRRGHASAVYTCQWHPDGVRVLTGSADCISKMWDSGSGRLLQAFKGHEGPVYGASFFPDGAQMLSVSDDHYIRVWDVETGKAINKMPPHLGHLSSVRCCAVSPDNSVFCTGGDDDFVRVWDKRSNMLIRKLISHTRPILSLAFGVDGSNIVSGALDHSMRLWDMSGGLINKWETNTAAVASCTFSPSGRHIICGSRDKTVAVYSNVTFQEVGRYICESACQSVAASCRGGGVIACGDSSGTTYVLRSILAPAGQWRYL